MKRLFLLVLVLLVASVCASFVAANSVCTIDAECAKCMKCVDSSCVNQLSNEDLKDECSLGDCASGFCDGTGACDIEPITTECRASLGVCDVAENCDGINVACPDDLK